MSFLIPHRVDTPELLDEQNEPRDDVERSLRDLRRFNSIWGGIHVYRTLLARMAPEKEKPLRVVDLGAGTADCLDSLTDYPRLTAVAIDFNLMHLAYVRNGSRVHRVVADALRLPLRSNATDIVTSSHFFHHFSPDENRSILDESLRSARRGVIVNDTLRHLIPLLFVKVLGWLRLTGRITRYDAPASVRRGYTDKEARAIGETTKATRVETRRVWPYRFGLILWK